MFNKIKQKINIKYIFEMKSERFHKLVIVHLLKVERSIFMAFSTRSVLN